MKKITTVLTILLVLAGQLLSGCSSLYDADGGWSENQQYQEERSV